MGWTISIPVWGSYVDTFRDYAAAALVEAVSALREPVRFVIHTDKGDVVCANLAATAVNAHLAGFEIEIRPISRKPTYVTLQESHADAVSSAPIGERVVLLNADLILSRNLLARCAEHFANGKRVVVLMGIRTNKGKIKPPVGAMPRALLMWAWKHRHQIIKDLEWETGTSMLPTNLFWSGNRGGVVARGFHLHPAAIVKQDNTSFQSTIDGDLLDCFDRNSIHVVTNPDDCAMCEVTEPKRRFPVRGRKLTPGLVAASMRSRSSEMHRWLFTHRIIIRGNGEDVFEDGVLVSAILADLKRLDKAPPEQPHPRRRVPARKHTRQ